LRKTNFYAMENPFVLLDQRLDRIESLVMEMKNGAVEKPAPDGYDIIDIDEATQLLGIAKPTVYGKTSRGEIPHMKRGKRLYFSKKELLEWLKSGRRKTRADIEQEAKSYILRKGSPFHGNPSY